MKQSTTQPAVSTTARAMKPSATKKASSPLPSTSAAPIPITVGLDLGDRHSHFCVLDAGGVPHEQGKVVMSPQDLTAFFARVAPARWVMEVAGLLPGSAASRRLPGSR